MRSLLSLFVLGWALAICSPAQTFTTLYNFDSTGPNYPIAVLVQGSDGSFYGETENNGANGYGAVYKITPAGTFSTLAGFGNNNGRYSDGGLVLAIDGNFYGTTCGGGNDDNGTVFRITPEGVLTTLHAFDGSDGYCPSTALLQTPDRNFYGTTETSVYKMTPGGAVTSYVFSGEPPTGLIQARDGNFYGTTQPISDGGSIFKMTADGTLSTLYTFCAESGCPDGHGPLSLFQAANGDLYGAASKGGAYQFGTVFQFRLATGALTTVHNFSDGRGADPISLIQATDGNLYGTSVGGTIFMINAAGAHTILHAFRGEPNGLVQGTDGDFYGTTLTGGDNDVGIVFRLSVGLAPFVKTLPTIGHVGATVEILGTDLTGATAVTFNGTPAAFTIVSATEITATVPAGATTGKVQVIAPGGALSSNVAYRVFP